MKLEAHQKAWIATTSTTWMDVITLDQPFPPGLYKVRAAATVQGEHPRVSLLIGDTRHPFDVEEGGECRAGIMAHLSGDQTVKIMYRTSKPGEWAQIGNARIEAVTAPQPDKR